MEFYKIYRRTMSKLLLGTGLVVNVVVLLAIGISTWSYVHRPAVQFDPPLCSESANTSGCLNHLPTLMDRQQYKQQEIANNAQVLSLPGSLQLIFLISVNVLVLLIILLAGTAVGSEYTLGTIRVLYTRGPSRLQLLWAKIGAIVVCAVLALFLYSSVTIALGYLLHALSQLPIDSNFFSARWLAQATLYLLACLLYWLVFSMMALFFATVGRSNVAGIVGAFVWLFAEEILTRLLFTVAKVSSGTVAMILRAIPTYFAGNATANLIQNQGIVVFHGTGGLESSLHAEFVVTSYLLIFIGLSSWLTVRRDVLN
jgi:ABC-type transport system involved in multi-copper enzyme maturation permease subunit